ncbi:hypothetical protein OF820_02930 [Oceanotoga sp. DSM 15011]|uniref:hypothetical protein n=1 Tax=unclassified Oceanotoga TaxID=2618448 RepID=UPI0021F3FCAD|nr:MULTISPECIES: hypothetical protein [unclassified Oceanotoga]MDN5343084.1 hypothetical protein [Oceanotoga sp.]UYP00646.1 hypothetical protein OF820_02930 [Oceanotoga sp. DSM 15011]
MKILKKFYMRKIYKYIKNNYFDLKIESSNGKFKIIEQKNYIKITEQIIKGLNEGIYLYLLYYKGKKIDLNILFEISNIFGIKIIVFESEKIIYLFENELKIYNKYQETFKRIILNKEIKYFFGYYEEISKNENIFYFLNKKIDIFILNNKKINFENIKDLSNIYISPIFMDKMMFFPTLYEKALKMNNHIDIINVIENLKIYKKNIQNEKIIKKIIKKIE